MGTLQATKNGALIYRGRYDRYVLEQIKMIPGRSWDPDNKVWVLPANKDVLQVFDTLAEVNISPEARALILRREDAKEMVQAIKTEERTKPAKPMPVKIKPFDHQIKAFNIGTALENVAILHEMGTGKSLSTVAIIGRRFLDGEVKRVLIVAPLSVVPVWEREFQDYADYPHKVLPLTGSIAKRVELLKKDHGDALQVAVINYEAAWRRQMFGAVVDWQPDMIVCDESQKIKTPNAKQSRALHKLSDTAKYKLILTGTPVTASPLDFWSQYRFLDPDVFGTSYYSFRNRYAIYVQVQAGAKQFPKLIGYSNKDELVRKAHSIAHRVTKADALDLPDWMDQELYCDLEPAANRAYQEMSKTSVMEIETEEKAHGRLIASNVLTRLLRLQQLTGGFVPEDHEPDARIVQASDSKLKLLKELLGDLLYNGKKAVIFARFIPEITAIRRFLEAEDIGYAWIAGEVKQADRGKMVSTFQDDPDCRIFVGQIQTSGLGITLHAADTAIFYSMNFSYADYDQAKARLHRIGQRNKVTYIHLLAKGTVDEKIYKALKQKKSVADDVVDGWRKYFG